jgi:hypothetical protein
MRLLSKISKFALSILFVLVLLAAAAYAGVRMLLADPGQYREALAEQLTASTGYSVRFENLEWQLWPDLAIRLDGIAVSLLAGSEPLAVIDTLAIDLKLMPLLRSGELTIDAVALGAVKLHLYVDTNGQTNYAADETTQNPATAVATDAATAPTSGLALSSFTVESIAVQYLDASAGEITASLEQVAGSYANQKLSLVLENALDYSDTDLGMTFHGATDGTIIFDLETQQVVLEGFSLRGDLSTVLQDASAFAFELTGVYQVEADDFVFEQMTIDHLGFTTELTGKMSAITQPKIRLGLNISSTLTNADVFNTAFADHLIPIGPITEFTLTAMAQGTDVAPELSSIAGRFNGGDFSGEAMVNLTTPSIDLALSLSRLNLDPGGSIAGDNAAPSSPSTPPDPDTVVLPVEALRNAQAKIDLRIKSIQATQWALSNARLRLSNAQSRLTTRLTGQLASGGIQLEMVSDYEQQAFTTLTADLTQINLNQLIPEQTLGKLSVSSSLSFEGARLASLSKTLKGASQFSIKEAMVDIRTLKQGLRWLDQMTQQSSGAADWPDDLVIDTLNGAHAFKAGLPNAQVATLNFENVTVEAGGGLDLFQSNFDYDVTLRLAAATNGPLPVKGPLTGVSWPAHCQGTLETFSPSDCSINRDKAQGLLTEIARKALQDKAKQRLNQTIENKAPEALKDLLKGLLGS